MQGQGKLIIIASPSGGGKTSIINRLLKDHPEMIHSISCTTRPERPGETNGTYYHHMDRSTFEDGIKAERFAEWAEVHGNFYGTPKEPLENWLTEGKQVLLDLDIVGSLNLKKMFLDKAVTIFIMPPSIEELKKRLANRATDAKETQELRLNNAIMEMVHSGTFDYQVINDDLGRAYAEVEKIVMEDIRILGDQMVGDQDIRISG